MTDNTNFILMTYKTIMDLNVIRILLDTESITESVAELNYNECHFVVCTRLI